MTMTAAEWMLLQNPSDKEKKNQKPSKPVTKKPRASYKLGEVRKFVSVLKVDVQSGKILLDRRTKKGNGWTSSIKSAKKSLKFSE